MGRMIQIIERKSGTTYYKDGKIDMLKELIAIWKPRDPLEPFTTNAILLELEVRLRQLEPESK